jgi:hypothetical protein
MGSIWRQVHMAYEPILGSQGCWAPVGFSNCDEEGALDSLIPRNRNIRTGQERLGPEDR